MQFSYDGLKRLSSAYYPNVPQTLSWTYDRYGNRISQSGTPGFGSVIDANTNRFSTIGGVTAVYDANGNVTYDPSGGGYSYAWDAENRLVTVNPSIPTATYVYDADSLRTQRTHAGTTYTTIYDGARELAEYTGGALSAEHVYGPDGKLAKFESGTLKYFVNDHLSRRDLLDTSGNLITNAAQGHYPFGEDWYGNSAEQFTSYERDSETENDYAIFRYYSTRQGRFLSPDRLAGAVNNPQSLNRYSYVLNQPCNLTDPLGLDYTFTVAVWLRLSIQTAGGGATSMRARNAIMNIPVGTGASGGSGTGSELAENPQVQRIFYCLWERSRWGWDSTERAAWITENAGEIGSVRWPWSATVGMETWDPKKNGPIPLGTVALAHTHPDKNTRFSPKPSTTGGRTGEGDVGTAKQIDRPVYVVTTNAVWKQTPGAKEPVQVLSQGWTDRLKGTKCEK